MSEAVSTPQQDPICIHNGCKKRFNLSENGPSSCVYHPGKPIFHDLKKGWTCCNVIVYDWDEFQQIKGCQTGEHVPKQAEANISGDKNQSEFFQSNTVSRAEGGIKNFEATATNNAPAPKNIDDFNKEQDRLRAQQQLEESQKVKKVFLTNSGKMKCINKGCNKEFTEEEDNEQACHFHTGAPIFHDLKKYWSCCKKETWDWDDFVKLPTCAVGKHSPKMV